MRVVRNLNLLDVARIFALGGAITPCMAAPVNADASNDTNSIAHQVVLENRFNHSV